MAKPNDPRSFLPLTPLAFEVLLALAATPRHGYGIIREIETRTDGLIKLRTGSLYVLLQRLADERLVSIDAAPPSDAPEKTPGSPRRYYALTPLGRDVLSAEARRLQAALSDARRARVLRREG